MKASDLTPMPIIDTSDVQAEKFNALLEVVKKMERQIRQLEQRRQACDCMNCIVIGV